MTVATIYDVDNYAELLTAVAAVTKGDKIRFTTGGTYVMTQNLVCNESITLYLADGVSSVTFDTSASGYKVQWSGNAQGLEQTWNGPFIVDGTNGGVSLGLMTLLSTERNTVLRLNNVTCQNNGTASGFDFDDQDLGATVYCKDCTAEGNSNNGFGNRGTVLTICTDCDGLDNGDDQASPHDGAKIILHGGTWRTPVNAGAAVDVFANGAATGSYTGCQLEAYGVTIIHRGGGAVAAASTGSTNSLLIDNSEEGSITLTDGFLARFTGSGGGTITVKGSQSFTDAQICSNTSQVASSELRLIGGTATVESGSGETCRIGQNVKKVYCESYTVDHEAVEVTDRLWVFVAGTEMQWNGGGYKIDHWFDSSVPSTFLLGIGNTAAFVCELNGFRIDFDPTGTSNATGTDQTILQMGQGSTVRITNLIISGMDSANYSDRRRGVYIHTGCTGYLMGLRAACKTTTGNYTVALRVDCDLDNFYVRGVALEGNWWIGTRWEQLVAQTEYEESTLCGNNVVDPVIADSRFMWYNDKTVKTDSDDYPDRKLSPVFVDPDNGNFNFQDNSPCLELEFWKNNPELATRGSTL